MKNRSMNRLLLIGLVLLVSAMPLFAQIDVTVRFNSATVGDTLNPNHFVQIRGELNAGQSDLPGDNQITWDNASTLVMDNDGGDYWSLTFQMMPDDTLIYKFWTGFDENTGTSVVWDGWEGDLTNPNGLAVTNRVLITGDQDTTLALQFYNGTTSAKEQYYRPYNEHADSTAFYFRVNMSALMQSEEFDPEVDVPLGPQGSAPLDPTDGWADPIVVLEREATDGVAGGFWSGYVNVATADLTAGATQNYKFVYAPDGSGEAWEDNISNRWFTISTDLASGARDTTLYWGYFDGRAPGGTPVDATITWLVDPGALQDLGFFDRALGDRLYILGPNGWTIPDNVIEVVFQPLLQQWVASEDFSRFEGDVLQYKYVVAYDSSRIDTNHANYIPGLPGVELWEEPSVTRGANRTWTFTEDEEQAPEGDFGYDFQFYSSIPPEGVVDTDMSVTFNIDMEPATDAEVNDSNPLFRPGVDTAYLYFESPILMLTQGLPAYEHTVELADPDGDGIYSATMDFEAPFTYQLGYRVGYTTDDVDVINGGGVEAGRRYYQFLWPWRHTPGGETTWQEEYNLPTIAWIPFELPSETPPDFSQELAVGDEPVETPRDWYLSEGYPNPFNPSATISYKVGAQSNVTVKVYSVLGQEVRTLVNTTRAPGVYRTVWNGLDNNGSPVASGMYFIRLSSPEYTKVRKITLLR